MKNNEKTAKTTLSTLGVIACLGLGLAHAATPAALEKAADPIVLLKVADLHVTGPDSMAEFKQVIAFANAAIHPALTYIAGDTPHNGTLAEYQAYKQVRDTLQGPVFDVAGDHEAKGGGLEHYRKVLGEPTYSFALGKNWQVVGLNSMTVDGEQIEWARKELAAAKAQNRRGLLFIHHNFTGLKEKAAQDQLNALVKEAGVKLVLAGHTHNNTVINDGAGLQITTTSIKEPRGSDPSGYAIVTLDEGRAAWHFVPLKQRTVVAICNPVSKLMATGPEDLVSGWLNFRVKVFDTFAIKQVTAVVDGGAPMPLSQDKNGLWTGKWDSATVKDGEHTLKVSASNAEGWTTSEDIVFLVSQAKQYAAAPATVSDGKAGGGKGPKGGPDQKGGKAPKDGAGPADAGKKAKGKKQPVEANELPAPVRMALEKQAGKTEFSKLEKENKDGQEIYTAKWGPKETERELKLNAEGNLLESKEALAFAALPAPVREAAGKAQPGAKSFECKKLSTFSDRSAAVVYEVRGLADGEKLPPLRVSPEGAVTEGKGGKAK